MAGRRIPWREIGVVMTIGSLLLLGCASVSTRQQNAAETVSATAPYALRTEYAVNPLGLDSMQPRLAWKLPANLGGGRQTAYRIRVADSAAQFDSAPLWDSGKQLSADSSQVAYSGPPLESRRRYFWQVQVWDASDRPSQWSEPAYWEMGLLQRSDWSAQWISGRQTLDHDWSDARITVDFTLTGKSLGLLFRARPVGKTYGDAYLWNIGIDNGRPVLMTQQRRYSGGSAAKVGVVNLRTVPVADAPADWTSRRHQLVIEARGSRIVTTLDGAVLDTYNSARGESGTIGFVSSEPNAAIVHAVKVEAEQGFATDFADGVNPFSGGSLVAGGLQIAAGVPDKDLVLPIAAPAPLLRRVFDAPGKPVSARLYVAAGGLPKLRLNGMPVGEALQDGYTDYGKRVLYRSFDVTALIRSGANVLGAELGRGWYGVTEPNEWYWHMVPWHAAPTLLAQLELSYADGRRVIVASDESWRSTDGPTRHDSVYAGERYDARLAPEHWLEAGFDDKGWAPVALVSGPTGRLAAATQEPIAAVATLKPVAMRELRPGVFVYDFGRIFAGRLNLKVSGPRGHTVRMIQTERVGADGGVEIASGLVDAQLQTDQYTLAGRGIEHWSPAFSYKGFRYVQVEGWPGKPTLEALSGEIVHSAVASNGRFESSNDLLNKIQAAARNTVLNNMHGNQTDTPTYEKNGWTGDAQASALASALNFDTARVWSKWLADFRDAQSDTGEMPVIVPATPFYGYEKTPGWGMVWGAIPSWDAATFVLPWELYQLRGDRRILEDMAATQKKLLDYTASYFSSALAYKNAGNFLLGEYAYPMPQGGIIAALRSQPVGPIDATAAAYYFHMLDLYARSAVLRGRADEHAQYSALAARVREAYNQRYWDAEAQIYRMPAIAGAPAKYAQTPNILAVAFGLVPDGQAAAVMQHLNDDIVAQGYQLATTGVYAGRYVMTLLSDYGHVDTAYRVATRTTLPGWGYWIENGLSTMAEGWELSSRSYDHHYWASISSWFYQSLAGIRPGSPGYAQIAIRPRLPDGLDRVSASLETPYGTVSSQWQRSAGAYSLEIEVPVGAVAEISVATAGTQPKSTPAGAEFLRMDGAEAVYRAAGGRYRFSSSLSLSPRDRP